MKFVQSCSLLPILPFGVSLMGHVAPSSLKNKKQKNIHNILGVLGVWQTMLPTKQEWIGRREEREISLSLAYKTVFARQL